MINYGIRGQLQTKSLDLNLVCADTPGGPTKVHGKRITPANAASIAAETGWFLSTARRLA